MFKHTLLRNIFFATLALALVLPGYNLLVDYPSFNRLLIQITEDHALHMGHHLQTFLPLDGGKIDERTLSSARFLDTVNTLVKDRTLWKLRLFDSQGFIRFSTEAGEIGIRNDNDYFHQQVALGKPFSKAVRKGGRSMEGASLSLDVVETYAPIMQDSRFIGAFELYLDITDNKQRQERLLWRSSAILFGVALCILVIVTMVLRRAALSMDAHARANDELLRSSHQREQLLTALGEGVYGVDLQGRTTFINPAASRILGWQPEQLLGHNQHELMHHSRNDGSSYPREECPVAKTCKDGQFRNIQQETFWGPDGRAIPVAYTVAPINEDGVLQGAVVAFRDISERLKSESALREAMQQAKAASKAKSEFLASMSHEIRTPMNGVLGMAELLLDSPLDDSQKEHVEVISRSGQALLTIINDILDFSKIEAGKLTLEQIPFNLERSVYEVAQLFGAKTDEKGIELIVEYTPGCPRHFRGDPGRIRQILLNLIGNAVKFTEKGHVLIRIEGQTKGTGEETNLWITVKDTGIGISREAQAKLFQSFTQADSSTTRRFGGTGLGLTISHRLMQLMGGSIGVHSSPGEGAEFKLEFSLPESEASSPFPKADLENTRVLLVDDIEVNRRIIKRMLEQMRMQVLTASSATLTIDLLRRQKDTHPSIGLALLDHHMPETDCEMLAGMIHREPGYENLPLIMLTSSGQRGDAKHFHQLGFSAYLIKPVPGDVLRETLATTLGVHLEQQENSPLITRHNIAESNAPRQEKQPHISGRVLLAEDVKANQLVAASMLKRMGLSVSIAKNGAEALEIWRNGGIDLILMDCQMPQMDGYEASLAIRNEETGRPTPVIALTANAYEENRKRCLRAGMNDFVPKPFQMEQLRSVLKRWLPATNLENATPADASIHQPSLQQLRDNLGEDYPEMLEAYLTSSREILAQIPVAVAQVDAETLERLAHSLKSASANMGARRLSAMADELEQHAANGDFPHAEQFVAKLAAEAQSVEAELLKDS